MRTADQNKRAALTYATAYFVVPQYAFNQADQFTSDFVKAPDLAAKFFYVAACQAHNTDPNPEDAARVRGYTGLLDDRHDYYLIEYPPFPPVDLLASADAGGPPNAGLPEEAGTYVLAPYFSAAVVERETGDLRYFVLGQSPDARTTLRGVTPTTNANLGPGCEPTREAFLGLLRDRTGTR
jgi:hypothetical protein